MLPPLKLWCGGGGVYHCGVILVRHPVPAIGASVANRALRFLVHQAIVPVMGGATPPVDEQLPATDQAGRVP
jgi:hypothetical protein